MTTAPRALTPPTPADLTLLAFANEAELAARDLLAIAAAQSAFSADEQAMLVTLHDHHLAAAQAINGLIGAKASNQRAASVFDSFASRVRGSNAGTIYDAIRELENTLVSTHLSLVGSLEGTEGAALVASILSVQARRAATLALLAGRSFTIALANDALPLSPGGN